MSMSSADFDDLRVTIGRSGVNASLGPNITSIADLVDVQINEPLIEGQILKLISGKWTNVDPQLLTNSFVEGHVTRSGTGYTTTFVIAHGFGSSPTYARVDPQSPEAEDDFSITWDNVNLTIEYVFPPPAGTDNLSFYYNVS